MKCTNCGAKVPRDAGTCPACGVFVRVVEAPHARGGRAARLLSLLLLVVIAAVAAAYFMMERSSPPRRTTSVRVVHDRPGGARSGRGATISEPEAILRLRRSLNLPPECVAILSHGFRNGSYDLAAVNSCDHTRLGRWLVDGKTGQVSRPAK